MKKLKSLQKRLQVPLDELKSGNTNISWIASLLYSPKLGSWVSEVVDDLDMRFEHLLFGVPFSAADKGAYLMRRGSFNPFRDDAA